MPLHKRTQAYDNVAHIRMCEHNSIWSIKASGSGEEEEEKKVQPANKTDHL